MSFFKKLNQTTLGRYPENSKGDFYVEDGVCTSCGAPEAEAPDLIEHSKFEYGHCYFKKQPETDDEIERAINAIAVSCISGLRYSGTDEKILKRLYEIGEGEQCDHKPKGSYKTLIFDNVTFLFNGSIHEISELITTQLILGQTHLNKHIVNFKIANDKYFEFVYRWTNGATGNIFRCHYFGDNRFRVEIGLEENGHEISIRESSMTLNSILRLDNRVSEILWVDKDYNTYNETELR
ncbi:MAG: ferredoxin [Chitinophagaceae bacterium]|nr:ferredoxin [Chitinophagaceae bacterium]